MYNKAMSCKISFSILIMKYLFKDVIAHYLGYCFGIKFNDDGQLILEDGSDGVNGIVIGVTTLDLLKFIELDLKTYKIRMYHIDGTYMLVHNGYPFIVFGRTDMSGHFFPISFILTTYDKEIYYNHFYKSLHKILVIVKI